MNYVEQISWIAFSNGKCLAQGAPLEVAVVVKQFSDMHPAENLIVLDANNSSTIELDLRGSLQEVRNRLRATQSSVPESNPELQATPEKTVGRPRLGVTAREVTLLPRHWQWLGTQPGGASTTLRKLVEQAMRASKETDNLRQAQESTYRFMSVMAGDNPGFEEASRALFAGDMERLKQNISTWPKDVQAQSIVLAEAAMEIENRV